MDFENYLLELGKLYYNGVTFDVDRELLAKFGGVLAIASQDARDIRYGFILRRGPKEIGKLAIETWRKHANNIRRLAKTKKSQRTALMQYFKTRANTYPQSPKQIRTMQQLVYTSVGTYPNWFAKIIRLKNQFRRHSQVMALNPILAGLGWIVTGDWDKGIRFAEVAGTIHRAATAARTARAALKNRAVSQRSISRGRPSHVQRGTVTGRPKTKPSLQGRQTLGRAKGSTRERNQPWKLASKLTAKRINARILDEKIAQTQRLIKEERSKVAYMRMVVIKKMGDKAWNDIRAAQTKRLYNLLERRHVLNLQKNFPGSRFYEQARIVEIRRPEGKPIEIRGKGKVRIADWAEKKGSSIQLGDIKSQGATKSSVKGDIKSGDVLAVFRDSSSIAKQHAKERRIISLARGCNGKIVIKAKDPLTGAPVTLEVDWRDLNPSRITDYKSLPYN